MRATERPYMRALCVRSSDDSDLFAADLAPVAMEVLYSRANCSIPNETLNSCLCSRSWSLRSERKVNWYRRSILSNPDQPVAANEEAGSTRFLPRLLDAVQPVVAKP
jgi:hypothetical protein